VQTFSLRNIFEQWRDTLRHNWSQWLLPAAIQADEPQIDMGNGYFLSSTDLLEGHYHRLTTRTVNVQVDPDLQAAITVVAPTLAPLTEVANEVADTMPKVQPQAQFRADLHRALELTHRQHQAQRVLGTRQTPAVDKRAEVARWGVALALLGVLCVWIYRSRRRRRTQST
jgi:hypothetical protein